MSVFNKYQNLLNFQILSQLSERQRKKEQSYSVLSNLVAIRHVATEAFLKMAFYRGRSYLLTYFYQYSTNVATAKPQ